MNREIKFRFWVEKAKRMSTWEIAKKECDRLSLLSLDGFIPMQFTGLKDKNGVEIYEGDILKLNEYGDGVYKEVVFHNGGFCVHGFNWDRKTAEVIGNIYENSDLL